MTNPNTQQDDLILAEPLFGENVVLVPKSL